MASITIACAALTHEERILGHIDEDSGQNLGPIR